VVTLTDVCFNNLSRRHHQNQVKVVEMAVNVTPNSASRDYNHPDDHTLLAYDDSWVQAVYIRMYLLWLKNFPLSYIMEMNLRQRKLKIKLVCNFLNQRKI